MRYLSTFIAFGLTAALGLVSPSVSATVPRTSAQSETIARPLCASYRLSIKVGDDAAARTINLARMVVSTIPGLGSVARPSPFLPKHRYGPTERTVWALYAHLTGYQLMSDGDYRLVLEDAAGHSLTALVPAGICMGNDSPFRSLVLAVRKQFHHRFLPEQGFNPADVPVRVAGVGFWDRGTNRRASPSNDLELAPVTSLVFDQSPTPTTTAVPTPTNTVLPTATSTPRPPTTARSTATSTPTSTPTATNTPLSVAVPSDMTCYETTTAAGLRDTAKGVAVQVTTPSVGVREEDGDLAPSGQVFLFLRAQETNFGAADFQSSVKNFALLGPNGRRYDAGNGISSDATVPFGLSDKDLARGADNDGGLNFSIPATIGLYTLIWNEHSGRPWTRLALVQIDAASRTAVLVVSGSCVRGSAITGATIQSTAPVEDAPTPTPDSSSSPPTYNPPPPSGGVCNDYDNDDHGLPPGRNDYDTNGCS